MKKTVNIFIAAVALVFAASCAKEILPLAPSESDGGRVLVASFEADEPGTKTAVNDDWEPSWAANDVVKITDGTNTQEFTLVTSIADPATEALIVADGKKFNVTVPAEWGSTLYAIYPSSDIRIVDGNVEFTIPSVQDGTFANANICVAKTTGNTLSFKNATAIVTFSSLEGFSTDSGIKSVVLSIHGAAGKYLIKDIDGASPSVTSSAATNTVTLKPEVVADTYYVAVAPVEFLPDEWIRFEDKDNCIVGARRNPSKKELSRSSVYDFGAAEKGTGCPSGMTRSAFSVASGKKVHFATANTFWSHNYEMYMVYGSSNGYEYEFDSEYGNSQVDKFYWTKKGETEVLPYYQTFPTPAPESTVSDIFFAQDGGLCFGWTVPTQSEWEYLFEGRTNATSKYGYATLSSIDGIIILPDNFTDPNANGMGSGSFVPASSKLGYDSNSYVLDASWTKMEGAGAVFLPAAGYRQGASISEKSGYEGGGGCGYYWASEAYPGNCAGYVKFTESSVETSGNQARSKASCIRMISE